LTNGTMADMIINRPDDRSVLVRTGNTMHRRLIALLTLLIGSPATFAASPPTTCAGHARDTDNVSHLTGYEVFELRRYPVAPGQRHRFVSYFEAWFPQAFEQLGAIVSGDFYERDSHNFTWLRGFHTPEDRAIVDASFYYGPVWLEHRDLTNSLLPGVDDNVLELRPLSPQTAVPVLPAADPVNEPKGAQGVVVAQIYAVKKQELESFSELALREFGRYRVAEVRPAGVLVSLDAPNNFPQLPVRTDGPYLVSLHILKNDSVLQRTFNPLARGVNHSLAATGMLRRAPMTLILDPGRFSRLRWVPSC
jgi:hypothetical protein